MLFSPTLPKNVFGHIFLFEIDRILRTKLSIKNRPIQHRMLFYSAGKGDMTYKYTRNILWYSKLVYDANLAS